MPDWRAQVIREMTGIVDPADWEIDADRDLVYPQNDEEPGWLVWCAGGRLRLDWGCVTFEADHQGDYGQDARRLLAAVAAWEAT